jgi:pimeloyl-ACP methyl ester carboxylesterase
VADAQVRLLRTGATIDVLSLHDAGGSACTAPPLAAALGGVAAMDLPGHGEGVPLVAAAGPELSLEACAEAVVHAAVALDARPLLAGDGAGALIALLAAALAPERFPAVLLSNLPALDAQQAAAWQRDGLPALKPDWHGGHLTRAWHMVRDARLFFPWFSRQRSAIRWSEPQLDPGRLQLEVRELLVAEGNWQSLRRAQLASDPAALLRRCPVPAIVVTEAEHPLRAAIESLATQAPASTLVSLRGPGPADFHSLREAVARARSS